MMCRGDIVQIFPRTTLPARTKILVRDGFKIFRSYRETSGCGVFEGEIDKFGALRTVGSICILVHTYDWIEWGGDVSNWVEKFNQALCS